MATQSYDHKLAAILYADVAGYSRLTGEDEVGTHQTVSSYLEVFTNLIEVRGGNVVHYAGDAVLADFPSAIDAVSCAFEVQRELEKRNQSLAEKRRVRFRIGVNVGEVIVDREDIYGDGVNVAARLEGLAEPGGVCVSDAVRRAIGTKLPINYHDLGEREVKNIAEPVHAFHVQLKPNALLPAAGKELGKKRTKSSYAIASLSIGFAVAVIALLWYWQRNLDGVNDLAEQTKPAIAVLPFTNMGGTSKDEYFADGMTDDLITDLSRISGVFVIARNTVFTYKGKAVDVKAVGKELKVRYVLEGSVRRAGGNMRINAQLIDANSGHHMWAQRYDRGTADIFKVQDEVITNIVSALAIKLTAPEQEQLARIPTTNLEAYDYYQRAEQGTYLPATASFRETLGFYERAISLDPEFADAYSGYARTQVEIWRLDFNVLVAGTVARKRAYEAATKALALDPNNPRAYSVLGVLQMVERRYNEAIDSARQAVSLAPNDADAHLNLGLVLAYAGEHTEAIKSTEWALKLNPKPNPGEQMIAGFVLFSGRRYEESIELLEKSRDASPTAESGREYLTAAYAWSEQLDKAKKEAKAYINTFNVANIHYSALNHAYYKKRQDLDHLLEGLRKGGVPEWPFGFEANEDERLDDATVRNITMDRTWMGTHKNGVPFMQYVSKEGEFVYRSANSFQTGVATVNDDQLCLQIEGYILGQSFCGYLYHNKSGSDDTDDQYIYVSPESVKYFSVQ